MHATSFEEVNAVEMWCLVETEHLLVFLKDQVAPRALPFWLALSSQSLGFSLDSTSH